MIRLKLMLRTKCFVQLVLMLAVMLGCSVSAAADTVVMLLDNDGRFFNIGTGSISSEVINNTGVSAKYTLAIQSSYNDVFFNASSSLKVIHAPNSLDGSTVSISSAVKQLYELNSNIYYVSTIGNEIGFYDDSNPLDLATGLSADSFAVSPDYIYYTDVHDIIQIDHQGGNKQLLKLGGLDSEGLFIELYGEGRLYISAHADGDIHALDFLPDDFESGIFSVAHFQIEAPTVMATVGDYIYVVYADTKIGRLNAKTAGAFEHFYSHTRTIDYIAPYRTGGGGTSGSSSGDSGSDSGGTGSGSDTGGTGSSTSGTSGDSGSDTGGSDDGGSGDGEADPCLEEIHSDADNIADCIEGCPTENCDQCKTNPYLQAPTLCISETELADTASCNGTFAYEAVGNSYECVQRIPSKADFDGDGIVDSEDTCARDPGKSVAADADGCKCGAQTDPKTKECQTEVLRLPAEKQPPKPIIAVTQANGKDLVTVTYLRDSRQLQFLTASEASAAKKKKKNKKRNKFKFRAVTNIEIKQIYLKTGKVNTKKLTDTSKKLREKTIKFKDKIGDAVYLGKYNLGREKRKTKDKIKSKWKPIKKDRTENSPSTVARPSGLTR